MSFKAFEKVVTDTVSDISDAVNRTGDRVSDFLKDAADGLSRQFSASDSSPTSPTDPTMGSSTSTAKDSKKPPAAASRSVPPFSVAYGVNEGGKTVLYPVDVVKEFPGMNENNVTVRDLQILLMKLTNLPVDNQKLVFKGAHLNGGQRLADLRIREGARMMMIGTAPPNPDLEYNKKLSPLEDDISAAAMEVHEIEMTIDTGGNISEEIARLAHKRLVLINEHLMKIVMKIDAVDIPSERSEPRAYRKSLVQRIHSEMSRVDRMISDCDKAMNVKTSPGPQKKLKSRDASPSDDSLETRK